MTDMNELTARRLLDHYLAGTLSDTDREAFAALLDDPAHAAWLAGELKASFTDDRFLTEEPESRKQRLTEQIWAGIRAVEEKPAYATGRVHFLRTAWFRYAAVLLLIAGTITFLYQSYYNTQPALTSQQARQSATDIPGGGNKAILTLADGSRIVLDSMATGNLASQGSTRIVKLNAGSLAYRGKGAGTEDAIGLNTIQTSKGGQYQVVLPDGSSVWLNAASSVTFPTSFGKERKVTMTGEAYFEVATDAARPFSVITNQGQTIQVLGTAFNVNAYADEDIQKTTLITGQIQVSMKSDLKLLSPGQQVCLNLIGTNRTQTVMKADLGRTVAWKNGIFDLEGAKLPEVMRQLTRWYDVEVVYEHGVPDMTFGGKMERALPLSGVVAALTKMGVHLRMQPENKRLVIIR